MTVISLGKISADSRSKSPVFLKQNKDLKKRCRFGLSEGFRFTLVVNLRKEVVLGGGGGGTLDVYSFMFTFFLRSLT